MELERRISVVPKINYFQPLVVYKWNSDMAHQYCLKIVEYLLLKDNISFIYLEDINKVNLEILIKFSSDDNSKIEELKKNQNKIKLFSLKESPPPDLCIVIGGDGTTLWTHHLFEDKKKPPFLNFNLGTLGYMSIYKCEDYIEVLDELWSPYRIMTHEKRSTIQTRIFQVGKEKILQRMNTEEIKNDFPITKYTINSLNEIVLEKANGANCICLKIYFNDEPLNEIKADGIIIATPTGSTAYNLSAGGAVIHYDVDAMILNAICPLTLSFRCVAFPKNVKLKFVPCSESVNKVLVNSDGNKKILLGQDDYVEITMSPEYVEFIVLERIVSNRAHLWKTKIVNQLGWNTAFKNE